MASDTQILRQYLVSLGFKVDQTTQKKFDGALGKTDLNAKLLLGSLVGIGTATAAMVNQFARGMEQLYYSSRRAESTAGSLQAIGFAGGTVGVGADAMKSAVEGMARAIRSNPGLGGLLKSLGVVASGNRTKDMTALVERLSEMPFFIGSQYAQMFGLNPDDYLLLTENLPKFKKMQELREQMAKDAGVDADEAARAGVEYGNQIDILKEKIGLLRDALGMQLVEPFTKVVSAIGQLITDLTRWTTTKGPEAAQAVKQATPEGTPYAAYTSLAGKVRQYVWSMLTTGAPPGDPASRRSSGTVAGSDASLPLGLRHHNPGNLMSGPGGTIGDYGSDQEGLEAMGKQLLRYQARGLNTIRKIIETYAPHLDKNGKVVNDTEAYIRNLASWTGHGENDPLNLNDPAELASLMKAMVRQEGNAGARGVDYLAAAGGRPVLIQQSTTIQVTSSDPAAAGRSVARAQGGVNEQLATAVRNNIGAVQ